MCFWQSGLDFVWVRFFVFLPRKTLLMFLKPLFDRIVALVGLLLCSSSHCW